MSFVVFIESRDPQRSHDDWQSCLLATPTMRDKRDTLCGNPIDAEGDKDRREGVTQLVRRQTFWQGNVAGFCQLLVRLLHGLVEHAQADVVLCRFGSGGRGENEPAWGRVRSLYLGD